MRELFVDTWFLIADVHRFDSDHERALRIGRRVGSFHLVTHDAVLTEFLTFFAESEPQWRRRAAAAVRNLVLNHRYAVLPADRALFNRAVELYENRLDKHYSLVDCMSMVVMKDRGVTQVLTNDHHFRQEGFTIVNE
jgi:predicted nucleic acid-binding protein